MGTPIPVTLESGLIAGFDPELEGIMTFDSGYAVYWDYDICVYYRVYVIADELHKTP